MEAREYIDNMDREQRSETAPKGSQEEQFVRHENWALKQGVKIEAKRRELASKGKLTEAGIQDEIDKEIEAFEKEAKQRYESAILPTLEKIPPTMELPEMDSRNADLLLNRYVSLPAEERRQWFRDALIGADMELAHALVSAPQRVTGLNDADRDTMREMFLTETQKKQRDRYVSLHERANAVVNTFDTVRRRLK